MGRGGRARPFFCFGFVVWCCLRKLPILHRQLPTNFRSQNLRHGQKVSMCLAIASIVTDAGEAAVRRPDHGAEVSIGHFGRNDARYYT